MTDISICKCGEGKVEKAYMEPEWIKVHTESAFMVSNPYKPEIQYYCEKCLGLIDEIEDKFLKNEQ